jgi:hypothetical protein
MLIKYRPSHFK